MLFKEYPYNGKGKNQILKDIESNKKLKYCEKKKLNDLLNKKLKLKINERISWEDYFNHPFFNDTFEFNCYKHLKIIKYYCKECKKNICGICIIEHLNHKIIPFYKIGLSENEINRIENVFKEIDNYLTSFNEIKKDIKHLYLKMKLINGNTKNIFKYLENINKTIEKNKMKLIDLSPPNQIICIYDIKNYDIKKNKYLEKIKLRVKMIT